MRPRALVLLVLLALPLFAIVGRKMPDFEVYWRAGRRIVAAQPLYRPEDGHYRLKYLPAFALLVAPIAMLPLPAAKGAWLFLTLFAIARLVGESVRLAPRGRLPAATLTLVVVLAMLKFFLHELSLGQSNALMASLIVLALSLLRSGRESSAGLALAAAVIVKPYAVAFLPYLAMKGWRRAFGVSLACVTASVIAPAAIYGWSGGWDQLRAWAGTLWASTPPNLVGQDNVSIWAMYAKWLGVGAPAFWLASITVAMAAVVFLLLVRKGTRVVEAEYLEVAALLMLLPLCSPQGWDYVLLVSTPAVVLAINRRDVMSRVMRLATGAALFVMAISVFDLMGRQAYARFMALSAITLCALVLLAALVSLRLKSTA